MQLLTNWLSKKAHRANAIVLLLFVLLVAGWVPDLPKADSHLDHLPRYNGREDRVGPYSIFQAMDPEYAGQNKPVIFRFSIQDTKGNDVYKIATMIEIYEAGSGDRIYVSPWTARENGDFEINYVFQKSGSYFLVVSVDDDPENINQIDPPRSILGSGASCSCYRSVFNISISEGFGVAWNSAMYVALLIPVGALVAILGTSYRNKRKLGTLSRRDLLRHIVMLAALAGGAVHLAVFPGHAVQRLEYSIFLISAGVAQVIYGLLYTIITLTDNLSTSGTPGMPSLRTRYRKILVINFIGLAGTFVLLGLYAYSVILPPPLTPNNEPEGVDIGGILAKATEVFLVVGIVYLLRLEKQTYREMMARA